MTVTDFVTFFLSIFFLFCGSSKGFMKSLTMPFSIIVTGIISIIYYQNTNDVIISLGIGLIGPFLLNLLLEILLNLWANATNTNIKPNFISRVVGSILTLIWGWVFIIITLIVLAVLPPWGKTLSILHDDVTKSFSYTIAKPWQDRFLGLPKQSAIEATAGTSVPPVKSLADDPRFQKVLQDPEVQKEINAHDLAKLMRNPKIMELTQQIMSDPATLKKVMAIYSSQIQSQVRIPTGTTKNP